ncbi:MAG: hypothetical protein OSJ59_08785, partial [Lachnospiraceae bacterium]|nr:hypothetical protein [Lachnospiraceae bacterium]
LICRKAAVDGYFISPRYNKPHDTRHTFITKGKQSGMDEYLLKIIVGHEISDVTEKVYTHRSMEELRREISKIP